MKFTALKRYLVDDFREAPSWFGTFLNNYNPSVDTLNSLFQNGIDIDNNLTAERQTLTVSHNTAITVRLRKISAYPQNVRLGYASGYIGVAQITGYNTDGTLKLTVYFLGTVPTTSVKVVVVFEP